MLAVFFYPTNGIVDFEGGMLFLMGYFLAFRFALWSGLVWCENFSAKARGLSFAL